MTAVLISPANAAVTFVPFLTSAEVKVNVAGKVCPLFVNAVFETDTVQPAKVPRPSVTI